MNWENLTVGDFKDAIIKCQGVAIIPVGCLEKHGYHMPLGTDMFIARNLAELASKKEEALVVPIAPYGIISEAAHRLGCLSLSSQLQYQILEELCDELARNGFTKIILLCGHGGAINFCKYFAQSRLEKHHPYVVYYYGAHTRSYEQNMEYRKLFGIPKGEGHADVRETSEILYYYPELVKMDRIVYEETQSKDRTEYLAEKGIMTAINWYGNHPAHIAGDPSPASAAQGEWLTNIYVDNLAEVIKLVKEDKLSLEMQEEFYKMTLDPQL